MNKTPDFHPPILPTECVLKAFITERLLKKVDRRSALSIELRPYERHSKQPVFTALRDLVDFHLQQILTVRVVKGAVKNVCCLLQSGASRATCEIEKQYFQVFQEWFTPEVCDEPVVYSWSDIVGVLLATSELAVKFFQRGRQDLVQNLTYWCKAFFVKFRMQEWIEKMGGWESMITLTRIERIAPLLEPFEISRSCQKPRPLKKTFQLSQSYLKKFGYLIQVPQRTDTSPAEILTKLALVPNPDVRSSLPTLPPLTNAYDPPQPINRMMNVGVTGYVDLEYGKELFSISRSTAEHLEGVQISVFVKPALQNVPANKVRFVPAAYNIFPTRDEPNIYLHKVLGAALIFPECLTPTSTQLTSRSRSKARPKVRAKFVCLRREF